MSTTHTPKFRRHDGHHQYRTYEVTDAGAPHGVRIQVRAKAHMVATTSWSFRYTGPTGAFYGWSQGLAGTRAEALADCLARIESEAR